MDKNVCDNTLVFGSCYSRSCIEMPSLKEGKAKWKAFYDKFHQLKGQPFYLRRSCFWDDGERNLKGISIKLKKIQLWHGYVQMKMVNIFFVKNH